MIPRPIIVSATHLSLAEFRWSERVQQARENELRWRVRSNIVDVFIGFIWSWMPSATALTTFVCYTVVAKERLTVAVAFTAIALFSYLQGPMMELPDQVRAMLHGEYIWYFHSGTCF